MEIGSALFEKYFRNKYSIIIAVFMAIIIGITLYFSIPVIIPKIIALICLIGITIYYIVDTIFYNKLPKNKEEDAILVRIISKDKNEYEDIKYKFGNEFESYIKSNKCGIKIIYIPYHLVEQNKSNEEVKIIQLLQKTNCIFLTTIKTKSETVSKNIKYITKFNLSIIHPKYIDRIEKVFQNELNILGMPLTRIEYTNDEKMNILEFSAKKISFICKYIIARAYYLSNEFENSQKIGEQLFNELKDHPNNDFDNIKKCVSLLCYDVHIAKILVEDSKTDMNIDYVEHEIEEANKYKKNTYIYYEVKSVCCFLKERDIKKTNDYLGNCKKILKNGPWKYSVAFLKAYSGEGEGKIIYHYKQAFKVQYEHIYLISFIEDILVNEPEKNMLRFALILLYLQLNDVKVAKEIMKEYLEYKGCINFEENTINQLKIIYNKEIINKLVEANK